MWHRYPGGPAVVRDVSIEIAPGESLAIVGESGAGKTTLAAILGGVFPAAEGEVWLGDRRIGELDPVELRRTVGVVTQEVHVFAGTLADDLRLAAPDAADEDLHAALRLVGADGWVTALPDGLATRVATANTRSPPARRNSWHWPGSPCSTRRSSSSTRPAPRPAAREPGSSNRPAPP